MIGIGKSQALSLHTISGKDFIRYVAIALISVVGVSAVLQSTVGSASSTLTYKTTTSTTSVYGN